jgi:hypothetical protein
MHIHTHETYTHILEIYLLTATLNPKALRKQKQTSKKFQALGAAHPHGSIFSIKNTKPNTKLIPGPWRSLSLPLFFLIKNNTKPNTILVPGPGRSPSPRQYFL